MSPDPRASAMTEAQLMEAIRTICAQLGLHAYHATDSRRNWGPGFPDLVIAGIGGVLWRECKTQAGGTSPTQRRWGYILQASRQDWAVWRPRDLLDGTIARQLTTIAGLRQKETA